MATISIYSQEDNRIYQVNVEILTSLLHDVHGSPSNAMSDYYLKISTTITKPDGSSFPSFVVRTVDDVPPGYSSAADFTELINDYVAYFVAGGELGQSSTSSSSSSSESSSESSSSSSIDSHSSDSSSSSKSESSSSSQSISSDSSESISSDSSSSSSGYIQVDLGAGGSYVLPTGEETRGAEIRYTGDPGDTADVTLDGDTFQIENVAGQFVWDSDNLHTNMHTFTFIGESWPQTVGPKVYTIIWQGTGSLIVSVQRTAIYSSSSDSSDSSSSYGGLPKLFRAKYYEIF